MAAIQLRRNQGAPLRDAGLPGGGVAKPLNNVH